MKTYPIAFGMLASFGLGAGLVEGLHAQASPPAYVISEIDVTNPDAYAKEYVPLANRALAESGQKRLVSGGGRRFLFPALRQHLASSCRCLKT